MMNRLISVFILVPVGIIIIALAVANRQPVTLAVPPDVNGEPLFSASLPLFAVVFVSLLVGMIIGSCATWVKQGRYRKRATQQKAEATRNAFEARKQKERADALEKSDTPSDGSSKGAKRLPAPAKAA